MIGVTIQCTMCNRKVGEESGVYGADKGFTTADLTESLVRLLILLPLEEEYDERI
jgi:uncharacterized protein YbbK (DUF523 family)